MYSIRKTNNKYIAMYLHAETFPSDYFPERDDNEYWAVWDKNDKPVGFCIIRPVQGERGVCFLSRAGLLSTATGKKLHRRMIQTRLRWAKKNGYTVCLTYTVRDNAQSYHNLQKCGFELYYPDYRYAGEEYLYWRKEL